MRVFLRLIDNLKPYWRQLVLVLFFILLTAASQGLGPFLIGRATDEFIAGGNLQGLTGIMITLIAVYFIGMLATRFQIYFMSKVGQKVLADLRQQVFEKIQALSLQYLEGKQAGDLMSRLVNDIDALNSFFSQGLTQMLGAVFSLLGIAVAMMILSWQLGLAVLVAVPILLLVTRYFSDLARRAFRRTRETIGDVSASMEEQISGVKVAQAFNRTEMNIQQFSQRNAANRDANVNANAISSAFSPAMDVLSTLDLALVAALGGFLVIRNMISVGTVVAFLQYVQNFFRPIQTVAQLWTIAQGAFAAAERVYDLLDQPIDIKDVDEAYRFGRLHGNITFDHVTFAYNLEKDVLRDINFEAKPGETIAIVGPTGAGKSTLVSLVSRFYDPESGKVLIDGVDLRSAEQRSLRSQMGVVTQEPFMFSGTIKENIRYGRLDASDEEIEAAAKAANAHDFIVKLSEGYDTWIGERGGNLSQGQRQLISIARAILANPRILIMDEATASVDTQTEKLIQEALDELLKGRTSFVIAHRLSTVLSADRILVLENGKLVEEGNHKTLLDQNGLYADLYQKQFYQPAV